MSVLHEPATLTCCQTNISSPPHEPERCQSQPRSPSYAHNKLCVCKVRFPKLSVDCVLNKRKPRLRKHLQIKDVLHWIALYTRTIQCWTVLRQQTTHRCKQESTCQTAVRCEQHSVISLLCVSLMICRARQPAHVLTGVSKPICMHLLWQTHKLSSLQILDNEHLGLCVCKCLSFALEGSRPKVLNIGHT